MRRATCYIGLTLLCFFQLACRVANAQSVGVSGLNSSRQQILLTDIPWQFSTIDGDKYDTKSLADAHWESVNLPHTFWNRVQPNKEILTGWYRREIELSKNSLGKKQYMVFEGVGTVAQVYVNGKYLGEHKGAYTRFIFDATDALHLTGKNELLVHVDNRPEAMKECLPDGSRLYKVWGGIYRKVWLVSMDALHIDPTDYASPGVYITPANVTSSGADIAVKVLLANDSKDNVSTDIVATLIDPSGKSVLSLSGTKSIKSNSKDVLELSGHVMNPALWEPSTPNLYYLRVDVLKQGEIVDSITQPTGFRNIVFKDGLVTLNGKPYVLAGADLHQEIESKSAAMLDDDFRYNFGLLRDLGFNWVRLSHYPRAQLEYDLCDQMGFFCWAENGHTNKDSVSDVARQINMELVKQNYNHPSIAVWSVGNESGSEPAEAFVPLVKSLDSTRPVVVANMKCANADFHGANTYDGWYGKNDMWAFKGSAYITETGAGGVVTTHTDYALANKSVNKFEPEEYQQLFAESHLQIAFRDNHKLGMFTWWNLRDFQDAKYKHSWNTKGLVTYSGDKKDVYYLFRAFLNPNEPTVWITSKRYFLRMGDKKNGIKVYSNAKQLTLKLNGTEVSTIHNGEYQQPDKHRVDNVFFWQVELRTGKNLIEVNDPAGHIDHSVVYYEGPGALPETAALNPLIKDLTTSNPRNKAFYIDAPIQPEWPIYYDFDSTADNSIVLLPKQVQGATWIALRRVTKTNQETDISFTLNHSARVIVMCTRSSSEPAFLASAGFQEESTSGLLWRDNDLYLVPAQLFVHDAKAGETIHLSKPDRDSLILLKSAD